MLKVETIPVTPFSQNARVIYCSESNHAVIVDPGGESSLIIDACERLHLSIQAVWLTHSHLDHCGGVSDILNRYHVTLIAHPEERVMRSKVSQIAQMYGLSPSDWSDCPEPSQYIYGGEKLFIGAHSASVLHTPGHSPGHVSFYFQDDKILISGDALFRESIGRTDLPGGCHATLIGSIKDKLLNLPDDTIVLSGHGNDTTIGHERRANPFLIT